MPVETADDRLVMLADFGVPATYTPVGGQDTSVVGIFDNAYEAVDAGGNIPVALTQPHFTCRTADVPNVAEGDALIVSGVSYIIRVIMQDGTGISDLLLEKQ